MDPNVLLDDIRTLTALIRANPIWVDTETSQELEEKITALDEWLTNGGFKPDAWQG